MRLANISNALIKRFVPSVSPCKDCLSLQGQSTTTVRIMSGSTQQPTIKSELSNPNYEITRKKQNIFFRKAVSDFRGVYSFVNDDSVADVIAEEVVKSVNNDGEATIVEINPGLGKITKQLIERGVKKLIVCESSRCTLSEDVLCQYKNNITIHYYKAQSFDFYDLSSALPEYLLKNNVKPLKIIIINTNRIFIRQLFQIIALVDFNFLANVELYILLSDQIYGIFKDSCAQRSEVLDYGFIDVFFDTTFLGEFPRTVVSPPAVVGFQETYFIRLKRKKKPLVTEKNVFMYWNFVNILSKKKYEPVLVPLEKWFPGCGPLLIANGLPVFAQIHEMSKSDLVTIFDILLSHGKFQSAFELLRKENLSIKKGI